MTNEPELDTELVRSIYSIAISDRTGGSVSERIDSHHDAGQEFDTWLAAHNAEVQAKAHTDSYSLPCDAGCSAFNDGPQEKCSRHGRTPAELWSIIEKLSGL